MLVDLLFRFISAIKFAQSNAPELNHRIPLVFRAAVAFINNIFNSIFACPGSVLVEVRLISQTYIEKQLMVNLSFEQQIDSIDVNRRESRPYLFMELWWLHQPA